MAGWALYLLGVLTGAAFVIAGTWTWVWLTSRTR